MTRIDLAQNLLELARSKAKQHGLENIHFQSGDMTRLPFEDGSFDVVVCVFGIFFVPNLDFIEKAAVRSVEANVVYATAIKRV